MPQPCPWINWQRSCAESQLSVKMAAVNRHWKRTDQYVSSWLLTSTTSQEAKHQHTNQFPQRPKFRDVDATQQMCAWLRPDLVLDLGQRGRRKEKRQRRGRRERLERRKNKEEGTPFEASPAIQCWAIPPLPPPQAPTHPPPTPTFLPCKIF